MLTDVPFEDIRSKAAAVVEGLTPDTTRFGSPIFREWKGVGPMEASGAASGQDRTFEVHGASGAPTEAINGPDTVEREGEIVIALIYEPDLSEPRLTRARVDEDHDLIARELTRTTNYFDDGLTITKGVWEGDDGPQLMEDEDEGPWVAAFPFRVVYETTRA